MPEWSIVQEQLLKNSGIMGKWAVDYIQDVSSLLPQITPNYHILAKLRKELRN